MLKTPQQDQLSQLDYQITNSDKLCGEGNITSIKQDKGYWRSYIGTDKIRLRCSFKAICQPVMVEVKICNANMIQFTGFYQREEGVNQLKCVSAKEREANGVIVYKFKQGMDQADQIYVDLHSFNKKQVQINSLKFYGKIIRNKPQTKKQSIKKSCSQIFKQRIKQSSQKPTPTTSPTSPNPQLLPPQPKPSTPLPQSNKNSHLNIVIPQQFSSDQLLSPDEMEIEQEKKPNYQVIQVTQQQIQRLGDVTEKWLECQRRMEAGFGVHVDRKLSVRICPKCLRGLKFCIFNMYGEEKSKYVKLIKQMGGLVRQQPSEGCIVVTSNPKSSKTINLARIMADTYIVKPAYIDECYRLKTKLKVTKFQYSPEEYFT